jgi:hypothetical protein
MKAVALGLALMAALPASATAVSARDGLREVTVQFPAGRTGAAIRGRIRGRESVLYRVGAEAGQVMSVTLAASNGSTYFNVYEPGRGPGDEALAVSETTPELNRFRGPLPTSGVYTISVYLYRGAARRNELSDYTLTVDVTPKAVDLGAPVSHDFADGLAGGPDYWEVRGVRAGDKLNIRQSPSARAPIVTSVDNGASLRNLGCRMVEGARWCRVETAGDRLTGWAAGRFLAEGTAPAAAPAQATIGDAKVPGTSFNATGAIPCARRAGQPSTSCRFGVVRNGGGNAAVTVFWPDGGARVISFRGGAPVSFERQSGDADTTLSVTHNADLFLITIGAERFEIPEAVASGG